MIKIDSVKCIGCGACVEDCFLNEIELKNGVAAPKMRSCMACGHCIAVCPSKAVTLDKHDMSEVIEYSPEKMEIDPEVYLNHLKFRRTVRNFTKGPVTKKQLEMILEAGRFSPTGGNLQNVQYFVSIEEKDKFKDMLLGRLNQLGEIAKETGVNTSWYSNLWLEMYKDYKENGTDRLFFDAPVVIAVASNSSASALISAAHMETMIYSLGLGMLYSGFSVTAIGSSDEIKKYMGIKDTYDVHAVLVIGDPAVEYRNTVPRKPAKVIWK